MLGYLTWVIILGVIWTLVYYLKPSLRKKIVWSSLIALPLGFGQLYFFGDYWIPETLFDFGAKFGLDIESFLLMFFLGGVAGFAYEGILDEKMPKIKDRRKKTAVRASAVPVMFAASLLVLLKLVPELSVVYTFSAASFFGGITAFVLYPRLRKHILFGGAIFGALYWITLAISDFFVPWIGVSWLSSEIIGLTLLNVPIEEIIFAFFFGTFWSSLYEEMMIRSGR